MSQDADDDALSWGDVDPTLASASERHADACGPPSVAQPDPASPPVGKPGDAGGESEVAGSAGLVALGVLGGVYLLYTIGWIVGGLRMAPVAEFLVLPAGFVPFHWLAVLAPPIWFAATLLLTRHRAAWQRLAWLAAGVLLLVPWPFAMIGVTGL